MFKQSLYHTYKRYKTLATHKVSALPIVILMPHSACNCRCVMCDIWKDNKNLKQLNEDDIKSLLISFKIFSTKQVVMSGGEALLNPKFFRFCEILQNEGIRVTLLSTGLTLKKNADCILDLVNDVIVSLDGNEDTHDSIRNISGAYSKLKEGVQFIKFKRASYKITARTVIHKLNYRVWPQIIDSAKEIGVDQISFLPADISSEAFNRKVVWDVPRQQEVVIPVEELNVLKTTIENLIVDYESDFNENFIAESPQKISRIYNYYRAIYGLEDFSSKKCNAPWVSAVIEADGSVKPCFFHQSIGNIRSQSLSNIINSNSAIDFRKNLDMERNDTCKKCVCYLNLKPSVNPVNA